MKVLVLLAAASSALCAGWEAVQKLPANSKIEVVAEGAQGNLRGAYVSATENTLVFQGTSGERSIPRNAIRRVRVADPARRVRNGLLATAIGAGTGLAIGWAICPHCANEGSGWKFTGPLTGVGAAAGSLGFLPLPYRTIYETK